MLQARCCPPLRQQRQRYSTPISWDFNSGVCYTMKIPIVKIKVTGAESKIAIAESKITIAESNHDISRLTSKENLISAAVGTHRSWVSLQFWKKEYKYNGVYTENRAQELCESRGGRPGLLSLMSLRFLWTWSNTSTTTLRAHSKTRFLAGNLLSKKEGCCKPLLEVCIESKK